MFRRRDVREARAIAYGSWEVMLASAILVVVLVVIDVVWIGQPALVVTLGPFALLVFAALFRITPASAGAWIVGLAVLGAANGYARFAGLAFPAIALVLPITWSRRHSEPS